MTMIGYVFEATNNVTGKKYIGRNLSVSFMPKYFGDDPEVLTEVKQYGEGNFSVKMLMPYETVKSLNAGYEYYKGLESDSESDDDRPKRKSRKKKVEDE